MLNKKHKKKDKSEKTPKNEFEDFALKLKQEKEKILKQALKKK